MNVYLSDELGSDSDDEKRMYRAERRAERKIKDKRCRQPSLVEAPSLPLQMFVRICKDPLQAIMQSVRIQTLPDVWVPVSR